MKFLNPKEEGVIVKGKRETTVGVYSPCKARNLFNIMED